MFGEFVYEQVLPKDHFLVQLRAIVPWERFTDKLVKCYKGGARLGRPPYDPVIVLKMLLLSYLYSVSERQVDEMCNLNLAAKYFLGLGIDERPPDHTTLPASSSASVSFGQKMSLS